MDEVIVRVLDFPCTDVRGTVRLDEDGNYNVYLNAKYTEEQQYLTYLHEEAHIKYGHLYSDRKTEELEEEAKRAQQVVAHGL